MKKLLLYLLLLTSLTSYGQKKKFFYLINQGIGGSTAKVYVDLPTPPTFSGSEGTDYKLLDVSMGSSITQAELTGSIKKGLAPNPYTNMLRTSQLVGTEGAPFIFKSASDGTYSVIGGATLGSGATVFDQTGATISDWVEFHHLYGLGHNGVASLTGGGWTGKAGGSNLLFSDIILVSTQSFRDRVFQGMFSKANFFIAQPIQDPNGAVTGNNNLALQKRINYSIGFSKGQAGSIDAKVLTQLWCANYNADPPELDNNDQPDDNAILNTAALDVVFDLYAGVVTGDSSLAPI